MPTESLSVSTILPGAPMQIYEAWTDGAKHAAMIGAAASVEPGVGGRFTAWEDYITGTTEELEPGRRIVQAWRTTQFPADASSSRVEIRLEPEASGTRVTIVHSEIPQGQGASYRDGWDEFYFKPMRKYFAKLAPKPQRAAPKKAAPKKAAPKKPTPKKAAPKRGAAKKAAPKKAAPKRAAPRKAAPKKAAKKAPKRTAAKKGARAKKR